MLQISIKYWLVTICLMVIMMIFLGGLTRLTGSGLSIVEWQPVSGIIPPINNGDWQEEFGKYRQSPEYQKKNNNMTITEFKFIFLLEFIHRLAGRITGLIYLLPLVYFAINRKITTKSYPIYIVILLLFILQGGMGWYMVKSGLISRPYVSHFRLACHLIIAVAIYNLLFNQLMNDNFDILLINRQKNLNYPRFFCLLSIIMIYLQIFLGGLVAGLDAGLVYNNFPLMGDSFVPREITSCELLSLDILNDPVFVQFIHRIGAYNLSIIIMLLAASLIKLNHPKLNKLTIYIIGTLILQILLGIFTILYSVPIIFALLHQFMAIMLLSSVLWGYFLIKSAS